jgi:hypothetical protein
MEKLLLELLEKVKTNRKAMRFLKSAVVACQQYELASQIRAIEVEAYPETEEIKAAKKDAEKFSTALRMVGLPVKTEVAWMILETHKKYSELKGEFSLNDATTIQWNQQQIFEPEI